MTEGDIQRLIMVELSARGHMVFRANVGRFFTADGRRVSTGLPPGFSDLFGYRASDGRAFFIEVKTPTGRLRVEQAAFLAAMQKRGALAGMARSLADAILIVENTDAISASS